MAIQPQDITLPPGVVTVPTRASKSAQWAETNLMRWVGGRMSPLGGWSKINYVAFASPLRFIHRWTTGSGATLIGYLCEQHLYVDLGDGVLSDISPVIPIEPPNTSIAGGYGDYKYNYGKYGTPRPDKEPLGILPDVFKLDNWGENLLAMTSADGRLLQWNPNTPTDKAVVVAEAPINNRTFQVTPQRFVILFGAGGDFNRYQWCDEEDITNWALDDLTSKGGDYSLQPAASIVAVEMSGADVLIFTSNNNGFVISYVGLPYVYGCEQFQSDSVPMSPKALVNTPQGAVWASPDGFWYFSGNSAVPLTCTVWDWVDSIIDETVARKTADFVIIPTFSELYFFFPSKGSNVNDRYALWNYKENWWANGKMIRACGVKSTYVGAPIMSDGVSVYQHESGNAYALLPEEELPWARTFNINLAGGAMMTSIGRMVPDMGGDTSDLTFELNYKITRDANEAPMSSGRVPVVAGYVGFRDTGRDFQMTIRQEVNTVKNWTMGNSLIDAVPRGRL